MKMAEIETGETYQVRGYRKARVVEKGIRTEWHRHRPRTSVRVEWAEGPLAGIQETIESRHLSPLPIREGSTA